MKRHFPSTHTNEGKVGVYLPIYRLHLPLLSDKELL